MSFHGSEKMNFNQQIVNISCYSVLLTEKLIKKTLQFYDT